MAFFLYTYDSTTGKPRFSSINSADIIQTAQVDDSSIGWHTTGSYLYVKTGGITTDMLSGSISDAKLASDYIQTSEVDGSSIEFNGGSLNVKAGGITEAMLSSAIDDQTLVSTHSGVNYTAVQVGSEGNDKISAQIKGIDTALGTLSTGITWKVKAFAITADAGLNAAADGTILSNLLPFSDDDGTDLVIGDFSDGQYLLSSGATNKRFSVYDDGGTLKVTTSDVEQPEDSFTYVVKHDLIDADGQENTAIYHVEGTTLVKIGDVDFSVATGIDLSSGYAPAGSTTVEPTVGDSVEDAISKLHGGALDDGVITTRVIGDAQVTAAKLDSDYIQTSEVDDTSIEWHTTGSYIQVKSGGISNDMLAGAIADGKLAADYIQTSEVDGSTIEFAGGTLNVKDGGITASQLDSDYIQTSEVDDSSIEWDTTGSHIQVKSGGITNDMLAGSIADGKLATDYIQTTEVDDSTIMWNTTGSYIEVKDDGITAAKLGSVVTANQGLKQNVTTGALEVDYDNTSIGIVNNKLAVLSSGNLVVEGTNNTGSAIPANTLVAASKTVAGEIVLATASDADYANMLGVTEAEIADAASGNVLISGEVTLTTDGTNYDIGKWVYTAPTANAGKGTKTAPSGTDYRFKVGVATATNKVVLQPQWIG